MATVLPPPSKRQKREDAERALHPIVQPTTPEGLQPIQFRDADTGAPQGPVVTVSLADLTSKNLSLLLNGLLGKTDPNDRLPYHFYNPLGDGEFSQEHIIKAYLEGKTSTEVSLNIPCRAEAVFKVKAVTL